MPRTRAPVRVRLKTDAVWAELIRRSCSQTEMAKALGVAAPYLSQLIHGQRSPSAAMRRRLLKFFDGAVFDDLFELEP